MIYRQVSAALLLRDGYTGVPFSSGAQFLTFLDGQPARPVWKAGGYLVFTDLTPGPHTILLRGRGFQEETLLFEARTGVPWEAEVDLAPGPGYPFRGEPVTLELELTRDKVPLPGETVWIGWDGPVQLKLAQDGKEKSRSGVRLYCKGNPRLLPIPGWFLVSSGRKPELVHLLSLRGEVGTLEKPLTLQHGRGALFLPARRFRSDARGNVRALFQGPGDVCLWCQGRWKRVKLVPGAQRSSWKMDKKEGS